MADIWAVTKDRVVLDNPVKIILTEEEVAEMCDQIRECFPTLGWIYFFANEGEVRG